MPATRKRLRSIYFDTVDFRLQEQRIALRTRRVDGRWVQTIKLGQGVRHGLSNPREFEHVVAKPVPELGKIEDEGVLRELERVIGDSELIAVFETVFWRTSQDIETADGGIIEAALDRGQIIASDRAEPICEIELELKSGPPHVLLTAAEQLFDGRPIAFSTGSKASRGAALALNEPAGAPATPSLGVKPVLKRGQTAGDALTIVAGAAAQQALDNWRCVLESDDPEGPHQLRVGLRRLRAVLRAFAPEFNAPDLDAIELRAQELGRIVSLQRDADVLIADILAPASDAVRKRGRRALSAVLERHRELTRSAVRSALVDPAQTQLKLDLAMIDLAVARVLAGSDASVARRKARPVARAALAAAWRKARRRARKIDKLSIAERHALRKALKSLRYLAEFFAPLFAEADSRDFIKSLKKLQNVFGYLNDVAVAERIPAIVAELRASTPAIDAASDAILAWHNARSEDAWKSAQKRWSALEKSPRFWE